MLLAEPGDSWVRVERDCGDRVERNSVGTVEYRLVNGRFAKFCNSVQVEGPM
jgi:hypothetical protein